MTDLPVRGYHEGGRRGQAFSAWMFVVVGVWFSLGLGFGSDHASLASRLVAMAPGFVMVALGYSLVLVLRHRHFVSVDQAGTVTVSRFGFTREFELCEHCELTESFISRRAAPIVKCRRRKRRLDPLAPGGLFGRRGGPDYEAVLESIERIIHERTVQAEHSEQPPT